MYFLDAFYNFLAHRSHITRPDSLCCIVGVQASNALDWMTTKPPVKPISQAVLQKVIAGKQGEYELVLNIFYVIQMLFRPSCIL